MGKKCNFIFYNSTSFFDPVLWSAGSGHSADITPFWSSPCLPSWCYSIIQGPSSLRVLSGREEWFLVPEFPLESQSLGAPGLLMADLLLPGITLRESSLCCPWFCFLETQHSHHLETDHFSLLLGLLLCFPCSSFQVWSTTHLYSRYAPSILCSWLLGTEAGVSAGGSICTLLRHWTWLWTGWAGSWWKNGKIPQRSTLCCLGPRCVCFILWELFQITMLMAFPLSCRVCQQQEINKCSHALCHILNSLFGRRDPNC